MNRITSTTIMLVALILAVLFLISACTLDNPFVPDEGPTEYVTNNVYYTNTIYVTNTSTHVLTNTTHYNHDEYYNVTALHYSYKAGWCSFYFQYSRPDRLATVYHEVSLGNYQPIPNVGTNYLVETNWVRFLDPLSNYLGESMQVKVEWDEEEYTYTNY